MSRNPIEGYMDNSLAAVFTMMLPGLGQMLKHHIIPGLIWSATVGGAYLLNGWLGMALHLLCILDCAFDGSSFKLFFATDSLLKSGVLFISLITLLAYTCYRTGLF